MEQIFHGSGSITCEPVTGENLPALDLSNESGNYPLVSVILPTWREERYIERCLSSILNQDYPLVRMEVLVVDGMSTDETRNIVRRIAANYPQVKLLDNPDRLQAPGLNKAIAASRGTIIVRADAHSEYGPTYIRTCVQTLQKTGADNVGGPQRPKARTAFQRFMAYALNSRLGTGGAPCRHEGKDGYVDTVFPGAFRRQALQRVGLFDPGAITNEDAEINQRIIASGGKVYLSSSIECYYYPRDSIKALAIQYFRYGRGRARTVLKHGHVLRVSSFLPFLFISGMLALIAAGAFFTPLLWAGLGMLALYVSGVMAESVRLAVQNGWRCLLSVPAIFATMHFTHAFGVGWGLLYYGIKRDWIRCSPPILQQ